ncbi:MAG: zinc-binding dehydrogenase [Candidatus Latescibacteria bacterium]|nr:zinc-binding dehydrogenase [Candidatus Latescibacterota bacterium]NIM22491.1 zinc-binding dehydrogenase [Candidatus Latescibacterota bacterium]NIM64805.1 zinc-binding dehydrogenase [Candidatus Latescibacterota bacterium]NIO01313.1 zinc-binding dehydrogenase [Candidatus Latescibacterota bacterium]NIO27802.1 zinc-binding dehydrogenase [Candidatus Latescibacterota bacterium]
MKAVRIHKYGDPDVLTFEAAPRPEPKETELLIHIRAAGVNPVDWKTRTGMASRLLPEDPFPLILGWDVSGVVEAAGNLVTDFKAGDEVYGMVNFPGVGGAYAEYVAAPADHVSHKPTSVDHEHAAALPLASLTAWQALFEAGGLSPGQKVLIHAAAGGVGHIAVQLAKWKGAHVTGTASARNGAFLRELGVDEFVDYTTVKFENVVQDMDVILDSMSGETRERSWGVLKKSGILVTILRPSPEEAAAAHQVRAAHILVRPESNQLSELSKLVDAGQIKPVIDRVFPLKDARKAHEHIQEGHTRGKIVLRISE